jgi:large subunit ribosomal protein L3
MASKGILGTKLGMTQVFDDENRVVPVTVSRPARAPSPRSRPPRRDGYTAVQLAYGARKHVTKPLGRPPRQGRPRHRPVLAELRSTTATSCPSSVATVTVDAFAGASRST